MAHYNYSVVYYDKKSKMLCYLEVTTLELAAEVAKKANGIIVNGCVEYDFR